MVDDYLKQSLKENENEIDLKKPVKVNMIDIVESDGSDIEIIAVSRSIAKKKNKFKKLGIQEKEQVYDHSVNCLPKDQQESYIKEEIIISDASDSSDIDNSNASNQMDCANNAFNREKKILVRNMEKQNAVSDDLSKITLNCPRCNKTETVFSATITSCCKDCNINMAYICSQCKLRYDSMPALYRHKKLQCKFITQRRKITPLYKLIIRTCSKCHQIQKIEHAREIQKCPKCKLNMIFECMICSRHYTSYSGAYHHSKVQCQSIKSSYYCNECDFQVKCQRSLLRHISNMHPEQYSFRTSCTKCRRIYYDPEELMLHKQTCVSYTYQCKFCSYQPKAWENLKKHLLDKHANYVNDENIDVVLTEVNKVVSKKRVSTRKTILMKKITEGSIKEAYCPKCAEVKTIVKKCYKCSNCGTDLVYECSYCHKTYKSTCLLYRHIRRQHGQQDYSCKKCGRQFSFFGDANEHKKNCGEKPRFECQICYFKTRYKHNLKCHVYKMHNENLNSFRLL